MQQRVATVLLLLCTIVGLGLGTSAAPVHAYPPGCATVSTDASSYAPGGTVTITAQGTPDDAGSLVTFTISLQNSGSGLLAPSSSTTTIVVTATANAAGTAIVTINAPSALGTYIVSITNISCGDVSSSFEVDTVTPGTTVPGVPPGTPPGLPRAGADPVNWLYSAAIVVFTGFGLWLVARRRRSQRTSA